MANRSAFLCFVEDVSQGASRGFNIENAPNLFAVRRGEQVYLYRNLCPHAGFELNWMPDKFLDIDNEYILCSAHGAMFDIASGYCIAGPCAGANLHAVRFHVADGGIYLDE